MTGNENPDAPEIATARLLSFISRAAQLRLRGQRNYSRYMRLTKGFVDANDLERRRWQQESAEDAARDAGWKRRHGPVQGGARVLAFAYGSDKSTPKA